MYGSCFYVWGQACQALVTALNPASHDADLNPPRQTAPAPTIAGRPPPIDRSYGLIPTSHQIDRSYGLGPTSRQQGASHRPNGPNPFGSNDNQEGRWDPYTSGRPVAVEEEEGKAASGIIKEGGTAASGIIKGSDPFQDPTVGLSGSVDLRGGLGGHAAPARLRRTTSTGGGGGSDGGGRSSGGGGVAAPAVGNPKPRTFFTIDSDSRALGGAGGVSKKGSVPAGIIWQRNAFASETDADAEGGVGKGGCPPHRSGAAAAVMRDASDSDEEQGQQYMKYKQQMEEPLPGMAGEVHDGLSAMRPPPPRSPHQRDGIPMMAPRNPSRQLAPMRSNRTDLQPRRE